MEVTEIAPLEKEEYLPTDVQLERAKAIRQFNFRFIYLPLGFISLIVVITVIGLIYLAIFPPSEQTLETISGVADAVAILATIPLLILCAIVPTLAVVATVQAKRQGIAPIYQLQVLLWRVDGGAQIVKRKISLITQKLANPFIRIGAVLAYIRALLHRVTSIFK